VIALVASIGGPDGFGLALLMMAVSEQTCVATSAEVAWSSRGWQGDFGCGSSQRLKSSILRL
jgi:hypothetical protein